MRKNIDVDNNVVYQSIKFELKIPYILGSIKMTKSDTF
jgi:tRNA threonylcarbamoyladenosine modification (KEOPS) complex  Pcc1 subunit